MFANNYISTIVEDQLPDFIRADHPTFVNLIKKYYEYLEQEGKTVDVGKKLYDYMDVDTTRVDLLKYFKSQIIPNFPEETELSTEKIIKASREFYAKKGTIDSFKFIFKTLYNQDIDIYFPKEDILKASDGKWKLPQALRLSFNDTLTQVPNANVNVFVSTSTTINANGFNLVATGITANSFIQIGNEKRRVVNISPLSMNVDIPFLGSGRISANQITITSGGGLHSNASNIFVTFTPPVYANSAPIPGGIRATANVLPSMLSNGNVMGVNIINAGSGYRIAPTITIAETGVASNATAIVDKLYGTEELYIVTLSEYVNFDVNLLESRQGIGEISRTTCTIEKAIQTVDKETGREIVEIYVSNVRRLFDAGENLLVEYVDNGIPKTFRSKIISAISNIRTFRNRFGVFQTGRKYRRGDPVVIFGGLADTPDATKAVAYVNNVSTGSIESIDVVRDGFFFRAEPDSLVRIFSDSGIGANVTITGIREDGGANSDTFEFNTDSVVFKNDIYLNDTDGLDFENVTAFANQTSGASNSTVTININTANYIANTTGNYYKSFFIQIREGTGSDGSGANVNTAYVKTYYGGNTVAEIDAFRPIRGTVNIVSGSATVTGNTAGPNVTNFLTGAIPGSYSYLVGKDIIVDGQLRSVVSVTNDFSLVVNTAFSTTNTNTKLLSNSQFTVAPDATSNVLIGVGPETELGRAFSYETVTLGKIFSLDLVDGGSFFEQPPTFDAISLHESDYSIEQGLFIVPSGQFSNYNRFSNPPTIRLNSSNSQFPLANGFFRGARLFLDVGDTAHYAEVVDYIVTNPNTSANVKTIVLDRRFENNINQTNILRFNLFFDLRPTVRGTGRIGIVLLQNGGGGYDPTNDVIEFIGTGYGASASMSIDANGTITSVTLSNRGEGYVAAPTILIRNTVSGNVSTGTGAILEPLLLSDGELFSAGTNDIGRIQDYRITNRGFDYANTPLVSLKVVDVLTNNLESQVIVIGGDSVWQGGATNADATFRATVDEIYRQPNSTNTFIRLFNYSGSINVAQALQINTAAGNLSVNVFSQNATISFNNEGIIDPEERRYPYYYGDGKAKANAEFLRGLIQYDGFYLNTDGFISADKKLQNKDYYHNYSYEIQSEKSLESYKETIYRTAHPAGMHLLSKFLIKNESDVSLSITSALHSSNSAISTNANASFDSNLVYGNSSNWTAFANANDLIVINTTETAELKRYTRLITAVPNNDVIIIESPIGGVGEGRLRTTSGNANVFIYANNVPVPSFLEIGDNISFNISGTEYRRSIVNLTGNVVELNATSVSTNTNVLYLKTPVYNVISYSIIKTNGF
jgi:hypothetical protein